MSINVYNANKSIDGRFIYDGNDLGCTYTKNSTLLKVWAPTADSVECHLLNGSIESILPMEKEDKGVWSLFLEGDREGWSYVYRVHFGDSFKVATDPYARASTANHQRTVVIDPDKTAVADDRRHLEGFEHYTDAVIYELNVRDFSVDEKSGMKFKGKFLGLTEKDSKTPGGNPSGVDYLKSLGISHIQLMPIYDFGSVDENNQYGSYNWGYDPVQYNVPEGSYCTAVNDPYSRIIELKKAIAHLHREGFRVIMDVVYNHMYDMGTSAFEKIVPGYYFRTNEKGSLSNGSFCGNDLDSTKPMVRKFMLESTRIWLEEFGFDGFRFDLMGIHDIKTMNAIADQTLTIRPDAMIYGEGWNMPTHLDEHLKATMMNHEQMSEIAHFSDIFRDAINGKASEHGDEENGYGSGKIPMSAEAAHLILGTTQVVKLNEQVLQPFFTEPKHTINYVECHDDYTLWDKLKRILPEEDEVLLRKRHRFITSLVFISQGIPFLHAGQEFFRTKRGSHNSYKSSDEVNMIRWEQKDANQDNIDYISALIALRKTHPEFRLRTTQDIFERTSVTIDDNHCIHYELKALSDNGYDKISVLINPNPIPVLLDVNEESRIIFDHNGMCDPRSVMREITVESLSINILKR